MRKPGLPKLTKQNMDDAPEDTKWVESIKSTVNVSVQEIEKIRESDHGLKLLESSDVEVAEFDVQVPDPWSTLTLQSPWTGTYKYTKKPDGMVEHRVAVSGGHITDQIGTLPAGYSPYDDIIVPVSDLSNGEFCSIGIQGTGVIYCAFEAHSQLGGVINYLSKDSTPVPLSCWPKLVKTKLKKVSGVIVMAVTDAETTNPRPPQAVGNPSWEITQIDGVSNVKITNIPNLPYNRKSRVKLLLIGG